MAKSRHPLAAVSQTIRQSRLHRMLRGNRRRIPGLQGPVTVQLDRLGTPTIQANSQIDAISALGYVTARDRLFQMDLIRRMAAGRLSEVVGGHSLEMDKVQRTLGFHRVAEAVVDQMDGLQRKAIEAYAEGVNAYIADMLVVPLEFLLLHYRPDAWTPEDCILVGLYLMQQISGVGEEENERMMTIMHRTLPADVFAFFTPDEDCYSTVLLGGSETHRPAQHLPAEALASIRCTRQQAGDQDVLRTQTPKGLMGSNAWVVGDGKTADGRAILANDMHLPLSVPNIWYRASLQYGSTRVTGLMVPGLPIMIAGSNGHVAWGSTNINGDFVDLVDLETHPQNPNMYQTANGFELFEVLEETIRVRNSENVTVKIKRTIWGPVAPRPLLSRLVAIRWTALDPSAIDLGWIRMNEARTVEEAVKIVQACGGPPLNVMLADKAGHIAWTLSGRIPLRKGFDGAVSQSWSDGHTGWDGYVLSDQKPLVIDPPSGFLVTANQRTVGDQYPYIIGHHFANGYRAYHASKRLQAYDTMSEHQLFALQLNTDVGFYEFYQSLVLDLLTDDVVSASPLLREAKQELEAWNGKANLDSRGIGLLVSFREVLAEEVFKPYLSPCRIAEKSFLFKHNFEKPLRTMLTERHPATLPDSTEHSDWRLFLKGILERTVQELKEKYQVKRLDELTWDRMNFTDICHPFSGAMPGLGIILDMQRNPQSGCSFCIRVADSQHGASMRLVVAPGHEEDGILHMPCGQSGRPMSKNYRDQHAPWAQGTPLPFLPGKTVQEWRLLPVKGVQ